MKNMQSAQVIEKKDLSEGIDIAFSNVTYEVKLKANGKVAPENMRKTILHGVSGIFKEGELTAIMGSSGAGKTTLLNVISGRISNFKGDLYANSKPYSFETFGNFANYVMQQDILMQTLTVRETLLFAANLKHVDSAIIQERVMYLTKKFKLDKCLDVLIGGPNIKGISGGEKKRTSIVFELMSDPQVIALDEPTSGMDSLTSYIIINQLKSLVRAGKTVFLTIHQPNNQIFDLFDKLILMVEGRIIYQGRAENSLDYFEKNFGLVCPNLMNPADFLIDIIHAQNEDNKERYESYYTTYDKILKEGVENDIETRSKELIVARIVETSQMNTLRQLLKRDTINNIRNPILIKARFIQLLYLTIFVGGLFFNAGKKDYTDPINWNSIAGFMFFINVDIFTQAMTPLALVFPSERNVFLKEENSKMYGVVPYFISRNIVDLPFSIILPAIYCLIMYWMVGLSSTAEQFFTLYLVLLLICFVGSSMGLLAGSVLQDEKGISQVLPVILLPIIIVSGFFKNSGNLPAWFSWIQYFSPFKYGFIAATENEVLHKASLISNLNFDIGLWPSIGILIGLGFGFRCLSLFMLWFKKSKLE